VETLLFELQEPVKETARILEFEIRDSAPIAEMLRKAQDQLVRVSLGVATEMHAARSQVRDLEDKAATDALTQLANRASFDEMMKHHAKERMNEPLEDGLGLLMIDIDHFKALNDTYGHQGGDDVLRQVSATMKSVMRPTDMPARYGGEEFAVVLPRATAAGLRALAERIRSAVEEKHFDASGQAVSVTVSIGGALTTRINAEADADRLIGVADRYLYEAKRSGRNRCKFFPGSDVTEDS
jgi:two-component system chemotaxis family response regulator WspR